jgi:hypothetical protein
MFEGRIYMLMLHVLHYPKGWYVTIYYHEKPKHLHNQKEASIMGPKFAHVTQNFTQTRTSTIYIGV